MNKINMVLLALFLSLSAASSGIAATSNFDCSKAKNLADLALCANERLAAADVNATSEETAPVPEENQTEAVTQEAVPTAAAPAAVAPTAVAPAAVAVEADAASTDSSVSTHAASNGLIFALIGLIASVGFLIFANTKKGTYNLEKRDAIKRYFAKFPSYAVIFIIAGAGLLATDEISTKVGGFVLLILGTLIIWNWIKQPTDKQMDQYIAEDLLTVTNKSLTKSDVDRSQLVSELLTLTGFRIENAAGADYNWKKGKDGVSRFTPINFTAIIMTENQLVTYNSALDLMTGNALNETTDEYFYKDVVSVSTETSSATFVDPKNKNSVQQLHTAEFFKLTTSGGTSIKVFIKDPKLIEMIGNSALPGTDAEKAVQSIRKMLREKKV